MHSANLFQNRSTLRDQVTAFEHGKAAISENTTERETQNGIQYSDPNDELEQAQT